MSFLSSVFSTPQIRPKMFEARAPDKFVESLCEEHAAWLNAHRLADSIPFGWQQLCRDTFAYIADLMAFIPDRKLTLARLASSGGSLAVQFDPVDVGNDFQVTDILARIGMIQTMIARRSSQICETCGLPGQIRHNESRPIDVSHVSCATHAILRSVLAAQGSIETEDRSATPLGGLDGFIPQHRRLHVPADPPLGSFAKAQRRLSPESDPFRIKLYSVKDVAGGLDQEDESLLELEEERSRPAETEHQARLSRILRRGEAGQWRRLARATANVLDELDHLGKRAPHFAELTDLVHRHLRAAINIGLPISMPPIMLVGPPGMGKTWYLSRLAALLTVPFRVYPMNGASLGEGLFGAHPSWRNAQPGLVARTLLKEDVANPVIFVDEFDKAYVNANNSDPYRPFYTLIEPAGSKTFVDEFLGFPLDASAVMWVMSGNSIESIPEPIIDRLTILHVPELSFDQRVQVAASIYAEANVRRRNFFEPNLESEVLKRLVVSSPREMRIAIDDAMTRAAADGRKALSDEDIHPRTKRSKPAFGFFAPQGDRRVQYTNPR
ncbi:AAA family ATPase [Lichenifustis flavocetrariae]|uniref:AAA family ATPase n=1 Tax=Lichenifustis flavocetrariae TaxID=2949735 RepID=A0AA41Z9N3_9HYPH|nr:AAA family ATPase [Lichenifustis flavocetrariae]MCW6512850.1 AAA family ATPase [Lichenifustis flavocetrariae]